MGADLPSGGASARGRALRGAGGCREKTRTVGAVATLRAAPGLAPEVPKRVAACHAVRKAVLGHTQPEMARCPLAFPGVQVAAFASPQGVALGEATRAAKAGEQRTP